jgi:hypothetical protein
MLVGRFVLWLCIDDEDTMLHHASLLKRRAREVYFEVVYLNKQ